MSDEAELQYKELSKLFGSDIVEQAHLIDVVDLNMDERMTAAISMGLTRLKQLKNNPAAQIAQIAEMAQGERLLLCMWIMEMDLLDKIQGRL